MFELKNLILEETKYKSGYKNENDDYVISASMVGKEPIQNYLSIIHGKVADTEINDATLGTIFHKGMEAIVQARSVNSEMTKIVSEKSLYVRLSNGWILSGTADLIVADEIGEVEIHDYKLTKNYTRKMMVKDLYTHDYTKQLQVLDALVRINMGEMGIKKIIGNVKLYCDFFMKDSKAIMAETVFNPLLVPNKEGTSKANATDTLFAEIIEITNSLQQYIESGEVPPECQDKWLRNVKGTVIPTKCALYCSHGKAGLCPHYQPTTRQSMNRLANW